MDSGTEAREEFVGLWWILLPKVLSLLPLLFWAGVVVGSYIAIADDTQPTIGEEGGAERVLFIHSFMGDDGGSIDFFSTMLGSNMHSQGRR